MSLGETQKELLQSGHDVVGIRRWVDQAFLETGGDECERGSVHGFGDCGHLSDDVFAAPTFLEHADNGSHLAVRSLDALGDCFELDMVLEYVRWHLGGHDFSLAIFRHFSISQNPDARRLRVVILPLWVCATGERYQCARDYDQVHARATPALLGLRVDD